jgi:hypothetical protein
MRFPELCNKIVGTQANQNVFTEFKSFQEQGFMTSVELIECPADADFAEPFFHVHFTAVA